MGENVELKAAQTLLNEGVRIPIPAPLVFRLFGKKHLNLIIRKPSAGTCLRVTKLRLSIGVTDEALADMSVDDALRLQVKHTGTVCRITALVALGGKLRGWLFGRLLAGYLKEHLPFKTMLDIMLMVTLGSGVEDFIDTIRLTRFLKLTAPNNLSQETQRS